MLTTTALTSPRFEKLNMVLVRPIHNDADYAEALHNIEKLWDAKPSTAEGDRLEVLLTLVEVYEANHHAIPPPDPIDAIRFRMEQLGIGRRELQTVLGTRGRVSEVLNRKRPLSIGMIRRLWQELQIPPEILIRPTATARRRPPSPAGKRRTPA